MNRNRLEKIGKQTINASFQVHRTMGPGLLESVYEECMLKELHHKGVKAHSQVKVPLRYRGETLKEGLKIDLLVQNTLIVELKAAEAIHPVHKMQLLSYLRLADKRLGFLINFNTTMMKEGIHRVVNDL